MVAHSNSTNNTNLTRKNIAGRTLISVLVMTLLFSSFKNILVTLVVVFFASWYVGEYLYDIFTENGLSRFRSVILSIIISVVSSTSYILLIKYVSYNI